MSDEFDDYIKANSGYPTNGGDDELDAYIQKHGINKPSEAPGSKTSAGMAALEHFADVPLMGYLPHAQALVGKKMPNPNADLDEKLKSQGFKLPDDSVDYVSERDKNIKRLKQEGAEHPIASAAGTGAGIIASAMAPAGAAKLASRAGLGAAAAPVAELSLAQKVASGAKTGASMGALQNPGDVEGELHPIQPLERAKNAAIGAVFGASAPAVIEGGKIASQKVSDYLKNKSYKLATRALGRPTPTQAAKMAESGQDIRLGKTLLEEGAIPVLGTPGRIQARVEKLKEAAGQKIGDLIERAGGGKAIDAEELAIKILDSPEIAQMRKTPGMESTVAAIEKQLETLAKNKTMTLKEAQALRQSIDKSINFNKGAAELRGAQEGLYKQRTALRDAMNASIESLAPGTGKDALKKANLKYSDLAQAADIGEREMGRQQANRGIGLTDTIAGAAGMANGGPGMATALALMNKAGRTFGSAAGARASQAGSNLAAKSAQGLDRLDPKVMSFIAQRLGVGSPSFERDNVDPGLVKLIKEDPSLLDAIKDKKLKAKLQSAVMGD